MSIKIKICISKIYFYESSNKYLLCRRCDLDSTYLKFLKKNTKFCLGEVLIVGPSGEIGENYNDNVLE